MFRFTLGLGALLIVGFGVYGQSQSPLLTQTTPLAPVPETTTPAAPNLTNTIPSQGIESPVNVPLAKSFDWSKFQVGGQYRITGNGGNFGFHPLALAPTVPRYAFVGQRFRLWLTYNASENVEGYVQMQIGPGSGIRWGSNFDFNKNFGGTFTTLPDDRVGVELRRAWLAVKDPYWGKARFGFLDWHDSFGDTLASADYDFNVAGIDWVNTYQELNNLRVSTAALALTDRSFAPAPVAPIAAPGTATAMLFALDLDQPIGEQFSVGSSVYYIYDRGGYNFPTVAPYINSHEWWFGVRGKWNNDVLPMNAFFLVNTGTRDNTTTPEYSHTGYAGKFEIGALKLGQAKWFAQALYATGGAGREFRTVAQSYRDNFGGQGYWSYLQLATPNGPGDVNDIGVSLQNRGLGLMTAQTKIEIPVGKRITLTTAGGYLVADRSNPISGSRVMGTEVGQMIGYDFGGGMKIESGAAFLFTGDFYRPGPGLAKDPMIYEVFSRMQLEF